MRSGRNDRARAIVVVVALAAGVSLAACTFLVDFVDQPADACEGGVCQDATLDVVVIADATDAGTDAEAEAATNPCRGLEAGAICEYLGGCNCGYCQSGSCTRQAKCPEGFNWDAGNDLARCCGGLAVLTNTNANCGVCGVVCKTAGVTTPQDCKLLGAHYLCAGCSANSECWSQCCSSSPTPSHCAASDCNTGACPTGICPSPSRCIVGPSSTPNYCAY